MRQYILVFVCICAHTFCFSCDLNIHLPEWMEEQIQEDLLSIKGSFSQEKMLSMAQEIQSLQGGDCARLVLISFRKGQASWISSGYTPEDIYLSRLTRTLDILDTIHQIRPLPDLEFLLSLSDSYDRPLFLAKTTIPVFTISKSTCNHKAILIPYTLFYTEEEALLDVSWEEKEPIALWRGGMRDSYYFFEWDLEPRSLIVLLSKMRPDILDACFVEERAVHILGNHLTEWMYAKGYFGNYMEPYLQSFYKYLIAIDGNTTPHSIHWQLKTESVLLKAKSSRIEWFYKGLVPGIHFLEFDPEKNNLIPILEDLRIHDNKAHAIALSGAAFAQKYLGDAYGLSYMHRLLSLYQLYKNRE